MIKNHEIFTMEANMIYKTFINKFKNKIKQTNKISLIVYWKPILIWLFETLFWISDFRYGGLDPVIIHLYPG